MSKRGMVTLGTRKEWNRAAAASGAGSVFTASPPRYPLLITVPRTATPIVAPTWRSDEISAEPDPLRSADRADRASR